ncbi:MAG: hypothetical protein QOG71_714 [Pyrinomonadaceae bacterium]|nr:hypothetical protein [Pyrinomonadaceae bacterium]
MDFIVDTLARLTATTSQLVEVQATDSERITRDRERIVRLEEGFLTLIKLAENHSERIEGLEGAIAELKRLTGGNGLSQGT